LLVYMTNPYRDPLSYVLLVGALAMLTRYMVLPKGQRWHLALSGLLTGLAYCVREPSLLAVGPMFLLGVLHERKAGLVPLLRSAGAFAVGLLVGALPLLVQTLVIRQQIDISPYSASRGTLLPGFHAGILSETLSKAGSYFFWRMGWMALVLFLAGIAFALYRRNRIMVGLVFLSTLYALFYGFYWIFSKRYYFIVAVCGAPLVAFGTYAVISSLLRWTRRSAWTGTVFRWVVLLLSLTTGAKLLARGGAHLPFRTEQARRFTDTIRAVAPPHSTIYCERPLADVIRTLTGRPAIPLASLQQESLLSVFQTIDACLSAKSQLLFMKTSSPAKADPDEALLRQRYDLIPVLSFPAAKYRLENFTWGNPVSLYRIQPWTQNQTEHSIAIESPAILRIYVGQLWDDETRTRAELLLNGQPIMGRVQNGVNYMAVLPDTPQPIAVALTSDRPVPSDLRPTRLSLDEPMDLDFGALSAYSHDAFLSPDFFREPAHNQFARRLNGQGTVTLPLPWRDPMTVFAEVMVRPADMGAGGSIAIALPSGETVSAKLPANARYRGVMVSFAHNGLQDSLPITLSGSFDLDRIYLHPARALPIREVDVGAPADAPFLTDGFYGREMLPDGTTARWTAPRARTRLFLAQPTAEMELHIVYVDARPPGTAPADASLTLNHQPLTTDDVPHPAVPDRRILRASLSPDIVLTGDNQLEISCRGWKPRDILKSPDTRELGLFLDSIRIGPPSPE